VALVCERAILTERPPLVSEVVSTFAAIGCHLVSVTDPYGRILRFLDRQIDNYSYYYVHVLFFFFGRLFYRY
jgi:hypothetical protein